MEKDNERNGKSQAVATIIIIACVIAVLASAATWFLFFNAGDDIEESNLYKNIKRYESEQMLDSLKEAMNDYLDTYNPDAFHYPEVKNLRDKLISEESDWMDAEKGMTADGIRSFLMIHPDGFYTERANACLDSLLAMETAEEEEHIEIHTKDSIDVDTSFTETVEDNEPSTEKAKEEHHHNEEMEIDSIFG